MLAPTLLALSLALGPAEDAHDVAGPHSEAIDALLTDYDRDDAPGAAVLVVQRGRIVHARGYGLANLETGERITATTSFRLGSVGKQFTATAIMLLAERGVLSIDDPVTKHVPELAARYGDAITIRHLLNHTSGLPDYYEAMDRFAAPMPRNAAGARVFSEWGEPKFAPGEKFEYSNPGYEMLGLVVERASSRTFGAFLHEQVFAPLGMQGALVHEREDDTFARRAFGYRPTDGGFVPDDLHRLNWMVGAGAVYASLLDLYRWDQALEGDVLLPRERLEEAFTPAALNDGTTAPYGFGWRIGEHSGRRLVQHSGGWVGFRATIYRLPEERLTVAVVANRGDARPDAYPPKILDLFLAEDEG